jgi:hypothetical protein
LNRVDKDHGVSRFPTLDQSCKIPVMFFRSDPKFAQAARQNKSHRIISSKFVAKADDDHGSDSTLSFKK